MVFPVEIQICFTRSQYGKRVRVWLSWNDNFHVLMAQFELHNIVRKEVFLRHFQTRV